MNMTWFLRMARWARNPPPAHRVKLVFAIVALGLVLLGLEKAGLWPDWATLERAPRGVTLRP